MGKAGGMVALIAVAVVIMGGALLFFGGRSYLAKTTGGFTEKTMAGEELQALPDGWPVPDLKLPPGATKEYLYISAPDSSDTDISINLNTGVNDIPGESWDVGFDTDLSWDKLTAFTDNCLRNKGFVIIRDDPRGYAPVMGQDFGFRDYLSMDGRTKIRVVFYSSEPAAWSASFEGHAYEVWILERPLRSSDPSRSKPIP